jgi:hypothetical protein
MADPSHFVPSFSSEAAGVLEPLDAFARDHGVSDGVRARLAAAAASVLERAQATLVEADIDQGNLQVVLTCELASLDDARTRLAGINHDCDGFSIERRAPATIEVWICFALG